MESSSMTGMQWLGIVLLVWGGLSLIIALIRPKSIWQSGKIQGFVRLLGNMGTSIMLSVIGVAAAVIGCYLVTG